MNIFTYTHKGIIYESSIGHYKVDVYDRYCVILPSGYKMIITRAAVDRKIWVQVSQQTEMLQPYDLVQATGEGIADLNII